MTGGILYRGQRKPKVYGHPIPSDSKQDEKTRLFWAIFSIPGIILAFLSVDSVLQGKYFLAVIFCVYLLFGVMLWFAVKDAQNIETLTPDARPEKIDPAEAEDYIQQINWQVNHRHGRHDIREWKYRPVHKTEANSWLGCVYVFVAMAGMLVLATIITWISTFVGRNSNILTGILIAFGIIVLMAYLLVQELKE